MALTGANNEERIWNYLKAKGLNDYGVAGCMGNLFAESALKPNNLQNTYLYERHAAIAAEVNKRLGATSDSDTVTVPPTSSVKEGNVVKIARGATYYNGKSIPSWVQSKNWIVHSVSGDRAVINKSEDGKHAIMSPINVKFLSATNGSDSAATFKPYKVRVTASALNYRKGAGTNYAVVGTIKDKGIYTIVAESNGAGANKWGKLKSGAGWISLDYTQRV